MAETKMSFDIDAGTAFIHSEGEYSVPYASKLGHRFSLVDGQVVDKYNGVTDEEVKQIDYEAAVALATEKGAPIPPAP